jgi:hypothetical protein
MLNIDATTLEAIASPRTGAKGIAQRRYITILGPLLAPRLDHYEINTPLRIEHFLAQAALECDSFCTMEEYTSGEAYEGGLEQWGLNVYPFYDELTQKLQGQPGSIGGWYVTADCLVLGKSYLEQVVNFGRQTKLDPKTGAKKSVWDAINHRIPVDYWDTEIYSLAAAYMTLGDLGWDEKKWEAWRNARRPAETPKRTRPRADLSDRQDIDLDAR